MTANIILMLDVMFYQGFMQNLAPLPHKTFCFLGSLTNKQVICLFIYFRIIQKLCPG